ncbi:hypothetical protein BJ508DRAFT_191409, partial [Ascobolus immersus RN42]
RIEPDNRWFKLLVHGVSVVDFGKEQGMEYLRDEINCFNPKVQLASLPRWLLSDDRREGKAYSSVVIAFRTQEEQNLANKGLYIHGIRKRTSTYYASRRSDQCSHCLKFGHVWQTCKNSPHCKYCAGPHLSTEHACKTCDVKGKSCAHNTPRCFNCKEDHFATSRDCK